MKRLVYITALALHLTAVWGGNLKIIVPYSVGSGPDIAARVVGSEIGAVIENKVGASGTIGVMEAKQAKTDGNTLLLLSSGTIMSSYVMDKSRFTVKDFSAVAQIVVVHTVIVASTKSGVTSVKDLIWEARTAPSRFNYASAGVGGFHHIAMLYFMSQWGVNMTHVPYKEVRDVNKAIASGEVDVGVMAMSPASVLSRSGKVTVLQQYPQMDTFSYLVMSPLTPKARIADLNVQVNKALVKHRQELEAADLSVLKTTPEKAQARMEREAQVWQLVIGMLGKELAK